MTRTFALVSIVGCGGKLGAPLDAGVDVNANDAEVDAEAVDAGPSCVPFDGASPPPYTSGTGCFSSAVTVNGEPACSADQFSIICVGKLPQTPIPSPDASDCTIIDLPTAENVLMWCCRCAF